jgi:cytosine deaminase
MDVVIAGGHGQIALQLGQLLAEDGNRVRGIIRNPDQAGDLEAIGVEPVVFDLEHDDGLAAAIDGADAPVFAAGAGPGSGAERKLTMDRDGAVKLIEACREVGTRRYVIVSAMGARPGVTGDDVFQVYLRAKFEADEALRASDLDWTVIRPGGLTNEPGSGLIALGEELSRGAIPREDVAATIRLVLPAPNTIGKSLDLVSGPLPIAEAVRAA